MERWEPTWWQRPLFHKTEDGLWHWTRRSVFIYSLFGYKEQ